MPCDPRPLVYTFELVDALVDTAFTNTSSRVVKPHHLNRPALGIPAAARLSWLSWSYWTWLPGLVAGVVVVVVAVVVVVVTVVVAVVCS